MLAYRPFHAALLSAVFTMGAATAQRDSDPAELQRFTAMSRPQQQQVLDELTRRLPASPVATSLRAIAAAADAAQTERPMPFTARRPKQAREFSREADPVPCRVDYRFGSGAIVPRANASAAGSKKAGAAKDGKPLSSKPAAPKPANGKAAGTTPVPKQMATADGAAWLHQALLGALPDADKIVAVLMQRLDHDRGADAFIAFLQAWRNHDESFYEALDRTAGTADAVFYFDVMLEDFRQQFGKRAGANALPQGLDAAHDALHEGFLAYRQYRAFREAIAWSLVLPPDRPLPSRLARYEATVAGAYSLRQQVVMVAAALDHDVDRIIAAVNDGAPPLPQPIWASDYSPYPTWNARFAALLPTMIERSGSSDAFLATVEAERRQLATALHDAATASVQAVAAAASPSR